MRFLIEELNGLRKTVTSFETADLDHMTALYHGMMKKETVSRDYCRMVWVKKDYGRHSTVLSA